MAMADVLLLRLNNRWRVAHDGELQWILQTRDGKRTWKSRRFHIERDWLLASIREVCGEVDASALAVIRSWPPRYSPAFAAARHEAPDSVPQAA